MTGRNKRGRFTTGNPYAALGWRGLVNKRFAGDVKSFAASLEAKRELERQSGAPAYMERQIDELYFFVKNEWSRETADAAVKDH